MHHSRLVGGLAALAVLLILLAAPAANALPLPLVWSAEYATSTNDGFNAVATAPDGVVYAAGYARANASGRSGLMLLAKYADAGSSSQRQWVRTLQLNGGAANEVAVDPRGNVIVAATSNLSASGRSGIIVLKYSPAGVLKWSAFYDGPVHRDDYVNDLALDSRGNALIVGASVGEGTGRDYITLKVRADGTRAWARRYAGPEVFDEARGVAVDPHGNVYVTGWSNDKDRTRRAHTICYSPGGAERWSVRDATRRSWSGAADVMVSSAPGARGVVITGYQGAHGGRELLMFAKYSASSGKVIWKTILPDSAQATEPHAGAIDGAGAPIAAGMSNADGIQGHIAGVSAGGGDAWHSVLTSGFTDPGEAEFDALAAGSGGAILAGGWTQAAKPSKKLWDYIPSAFAVRYSPGWPIVAPLDYVGPGSATTRSRCNAVAIGTHGMYAVGEQTNASGDLDAVLLKF
jgi:hypothetical protein